MACIQDQLFTLRRMTKLLSKSPMNRHTISQSIGMHSALYNKQIEYRELPSCLFLRHGVRQKLSCWYDGPSYITQCPIQPGQSFTYEFTLLKQKGTLLWHAHSSWLRGTVYGAIVVYPKTGLSYPFKPPYEEHIVILGISLVAYLYCFFGLCLI